MPPKHQKEAIAKSIIALTDYSHGMLIDKHPQQGQFVVTGPQVGNALEGRIGFCVQVRKGIGVFGSDVVFLRHMDGNLITHENQAYFAMSEEQEGLARSVFESLPEEEDYSCGYRCCNKVHEIGFVIENSKSSPAQVAPVMITVEQHDKDGAPTTTCIAII